MACIRVPHPSSVPAQDGHKESELGFCRSLPGHFLIKSPDQTAKICFDRQSGAKGRLNVGHQKGSRHPFSGNVADQNRKSTSRKRKVIEEVSSQLFSRH